MTYSHAHGKHARYLGATSCPSDHTCGHPLPRVCPKGRLNGAYRLTVYVCHAFCSKVQATSTDLLFGAGGAPGRLRYDRVSTWCTLAGLRLGLLGSRVPRPTYNVGRQPLSRALQRLASDEGEEPEARQHGYRPLHRQLEPRHRPRHPDRWSSCLNEGHVETALQRLRNAHSGRRRSLT